MNTTTAGTELVEGEVTETGSALALIEPMGVSLARAEIDVQIATARRYPRSIALASKNIRALVTLDKDAAEECMYALPRGGKPIQGPSIRLAEIIFQCWGNARCDARVVGVDRVEKVIIAEGVYHDLETNSAGRATVRRSIADKNGRIFKDDMIAVTGNAACSIAKRNAILAGVPKTVWNRAYLDAREVVAGTLKTLGVSRQQAISAFANFGVKPEQIFPAISVGGLEEITLEHIPILRGMFAALKSGEATVEEMFPVQRPGAAAGSSPISLGAKLDALATQADEDKSEPVIIDHDSETGEVAVNSAAEAKSEAEVATGGVAPADPDDSPRDLLLADLRDAIDQGGRVSKLLNDLGDRREMLTEEDVKTLRAREKKVQGGQG